MRPINVLSRLFCQFCVIIGVPFDAAGVGRRDPKQILEATGIQGGLIVHVGCKNDGNFSTAGVACQCQSPSSWTGPDVSTLRPGPRAHEGTRRLRKNRG